MNLEWSITIAGYDGYAHRGLRSYGSYLDSATSHHMLIDWAAATGGEFRGRAGYL